MKKIDPQITQITQITQIFQRAMLNCRRLGRLRDGALRALVLTNYGIDGLGLSNLYNLYNLWINLSKSGDADVA